MSNLPRGAVWVLAGAGILLMAFLGVMAGNQYLRWRESTDLEQRLKSAAVGEGSALRIGQKLPDVDIVGTDGMSTNIQAFARDADLLVVFLSITCEPCTESVRSLVPPTEQSHVRVIGICEDDVEYARVYVEKNEFPFAVYSDTGSVFFEQYAVSVFPTVLGVGRGGEIVFVKHGADPGFGYEDAIRLLRSSSHESMEN